MARSLSVFTSSADKFSVAETIAWPFNAAGSNETYSVLHTKCPILDFKLSPCSVCCMLFWGNYPASGVYMPTFRNTLSVPSSYASIRE